MRNKFMLSVLIPVVILLAMTVQPLLTVLYGQEIRIKTVPVDPTDLFRGDYVNLDYEINALPISKFPELEQIKNKLGDYKFEEEYRGRQVYVSLKEDNGYYVIDRASFQKPEGGVYLNGRVTHFFVQQPPLQPAEPAKPRPFEEKEYLPDTVGVNYQLDKFFVPENTGLKLEELSRKGQLAATVKVYQGYAQLLHVEQAAEKK